MNTKIIGILLPIIAVAIILFINQNNMSNIRYSNQPTDIATTSTSPTGFVSRLKDQPTDNLEVLSSRLSGLETTIITETNSEDTREVKSGDEITVNYRGWLASTGKIFDQSFNRGDTGFTFTVGQGVIDGWSQGVVGMKLNEIRRLRIPANLGYGNSGAGTIPADSDLLFDVELLQFKN